MRSFSCTLTTDSSSESMFCCCSKYPNCLGIPFFLGILKILQAANSAARQRSALGMLSRFCLHHPALAHSCIFAASAHIAYASSNMEIIWKRWRRRCSYSNSVACCDISPTSPSSPSRVGNISSLVFSNHVGDISSSHVSDTSCTS